MQKTTENFFLHAAEIDRFSELTGSILQQLQMKPRDILRFRLSIENVMEIWMRELGENTRCTFSSGSRFGRTYITLSAEGKSVDPNEYQDELTANISNGSSILTTLGLTLEYHYDNGKNFLKLALPKKQSGQMTPVLIGMLLGIIFGAIFTFGLPKAGNTIQTWIVSPLFDTLMNLLSVIAGPMIFLAVYCGIYEMGDAATFGKIGKSLILRFLLFTFLALIATALVMSWLFLSPSGTNTIAENSIMDLYQMILNIIPSDIISPFQTGNALQIIFLACVCGIATLVLGDSVSGIVKIVSQINSMVQLLMDYIGRLLPLFVFICMMNLFLSGSLGNISGIIKQVALVAGMTFLILVVYISSICRKCKIKPMTLIRKLLPTFLIAISTASSSAAFGTNIDSCEKKLGIEKKLVNFGVPMGQVVFMPIGAIMFLISSLCIGQSYGVEITVIWIITSILTSGILAIASPPIPGGALSCYTILFTQLNIPAAGVALAVSIDLLMDSFITATNLACLQMELVLSAQKLDMLNKNRLQKQA